MADGLHFLATRRVAGLEVRQDDLAVFQRRFGIVAALDVGAKEAGEIDALARGAEGGLAGLEGDRHGGLPRVGHLRGHGALPDQLVERQVPPVETGLLRVAEGGAGRPDGLVGLLRVGALRGVPAGRVGEVVGAIEGGDRLPRGADGLLRQVDRVGTHVGDEAALVEPLRRPHGVARAQPELAVGFLLQRGGGEGRRRTADAGLFLGGGDPPGVLGRALAERRGGRLVEHHHIATAEQPTGALVEVLARRELLALELDQLGVEGLAVVPERGEEIPVGRRAEGPTLALADHEQPHGHRLDPAGGESEGDLLPEQGRQGVADQPVEDAPGFLRAHQPVVDVPRIGEGLGDGLARDFVKDHPPHRHVGLEELEQVPRDALALAVLVGREEELVDVPHRRLEVAHDALLVGGDHVERLEVVLDVHAEAGPLDALVLRGDGLGVARQVPDMAHRRLDAISRRQEARGWSAPWSATRR